MRLALAVISVVVLAIHAVVFYDQLFAKWQDHQAQYFEQARQGRHPAATRHPRRAGGRRSSRSIVAASARSASIAARPATSRSTTRASRRPTSRCAPTRRSPATSSRPFGCTICHDGQGRAVEPRRAHEGGEDWPWPMLPKEADRGHLRPVPPDADWPARPARPPGPPPLLRARLLHLPHDRRALRRLDRPRADRGRPQAAHRRTSWGRSRTRAHRTPPRRCRSRT